MDRHQPVAMLNLYLYKNTKYRNMQNSTLCAFQSWVSVCSTIPECGIHLCVDDTTLSFRCCTNSTQKLLFSLSINLHIYYHYFFMNKSSFYCPHQKWSCLLMILYISSCSHVSVIFRIKQVQLLNSLKSWGG